MSPSARKAFRHVWTIYNRFDRFEDPRTIYFIFELNTLSLMHINIYSTLRHLRLPTQIELTVPTHLSYLTTGLRTRGGSDARCAR